MKRGPDRKATRYRGGSRPGARRRKVPVEQDPDREFIVIWRTLSRVFGHDSRGAGKLAAHFVSDEAIVLSDNLDSGPLALGPMAQVLFNPGRPKEHVNVEMSPDARRYDCTFSLLCRIGRARDEG
jgi:hypothetical protein